MTDNYQTIEDATIQATTEAIKETGKRYFTGHTEFACKYGVNVAILFDKLVRLHQHVKGKIDDDGNHWVRMTLDEWEVELPFWSRNTIDRTIKEATTDTKKAKAVILTRTFTGRSKWYRCDPDCLSPDQDVSPQNGDMYHPKMGSPLPQNGELPNSFPNSVPKPLSKGKSPKNPKPQKPKTKWENAGPVASSVIKVTKLKPSAIVNGTELDLKNVLRFLKTENIEPDRVLEFAKWYGKTPTLKSITDNWGRFESGELPPHKLYRQNNNSGNHNDNSKKPTEIKLTPEQKQRADELNRQLEAATKGI